MHFLAKLIRTYFPRNCSLKETPDQMFLFFCFLKRNLSSTQCRLFSSNDTNINTTLKNLTENILFVIYVRHEYSYYFLSCSHQALLMIENSNN